MFGAGSRERRPVQPWGPRVAGRRSGLRLGLLCVAVALIAFALAWVDLPWAEQAGIGPYAVHSLLMAVLLVAYIVTNHGNLRRAALQFVTWFGLIAIVAIGYGMRHELTDAGYRVLAIFIPSYGYSADAQTISYAAAPDGHFWINARANGVGFRFMVDTGATTVVFSRADARRLGLDPATLRFDQVVSTANGRTTAAAIRLRDIAIGPIVVTDVPALVTAGDLSEPLLGMRLLERMSAVEIKNGKLTLRR
jgi:aspartyl protease family protein